MFLELRNTFYPTNTMPHKRENDNHVHTSVPVYMQFNSGFQNYDIGDDDDDHRDNNDGDIKDDND